MNKTTRSSSQNYLITGFLTILPIFLTVYIIYLISNFLSRLSSPLLEPILRPHLAVTYSDFLIFISGILMTIIIIWTIGLVVTNFFGKKIFLMFDRLFERIPFFKNIYISIRRLIEHLTMTKMAFRKVVLLEYPRKGIYSIGFITSETMEQIQQVTPEHLINIFVPTTPNPTSGVLVMVPREEVIYLKMTTDEAFFFIMSGGIVTPGSEIGGAREIHGP
ncbi:MAG: DUF502 domain-containing protein [Elusimicrobia bacterium]|nr:DUF502 domain-containing protein [Elusimicrobiota bacterium]MBD3412402.1 DUF502 domain-containing protein [Elusimicrobiota bacterium]